MKRFETFYKYFYVDYRFLGLFDEVFVDLGDFKRFLDFGGF